MYVLKIKGTGKVQEYIQIRDDAFNLIAYFSAKTIQESLKKYKLEKFQSQINEAIEENPFGKLIKIC